MANYYIDYYATISKDKNDSLFMDNYKEIILSIHKEQEFEEETKTYSYKQYEALKYHIAYEYCLNLFFLTLERLANETIEQSELRRKQEYSYKLVQEIMAHRGIDIHRIFENIKIIYAPIDFTTEEITYPHYEA